MHSHSSEGQLTVSRREEFTGCRHRERAGLTLCYCCVWESYFTTVGVIISYLLASSLQLSNAHSRVSEISKQSFILNPYLILAILPEYPVEIGTFSPHRDHKSSICFTITTLLSLMFALVSLDLIYMVTELARCSDVMWEIVRDHETKICIVKRAA